MVYMYCLVHFRRQSRLFMCFYTNGLTVSYKYFILLTAPNRAPMRLLTIPMLLLLLAVLSVQAQEEFIPPPAKLIAKFPFKLLTGGIITIKARLSNYPDTLNFILDTGSGGISLDSSTANYLKVPTTLSDRTIRGIA